MSEQPFGLLELGTNSLKFYRVEFNAGTGHTVKPHKFTWRVGHDFFAQGRLSEATVDELITKLRSVEKVAEGIPMTSMLAVATGVFRELPNIAQLGAHVKAQTGIRLRVITGEDEAKLMAKGFARAPRGGSVLLCDLGGATTEWAWMLDGAAQSWGSLPLGAIRNEYRFGSLRGDAAGYLTASSEHCDKVLASLVVPSPTNVMATGGTAKAAANVAQKTLLPFDELHALTESVLKHGPPSVLKPERQAVFLPGLVILERLCARCGSAHLEYAQTSVRDGMAERLIQLLGTHRRQDLHSTLLLHTRGA
jgi:exopolyphosphatase/pppGpp-phosphohydrolase